MRLAFLIVLMFTLFFVAACIEPIDLPGDVQAPYDQDDPRTLPGTVQAEHFDTGGEGVAYHDTTPENLGGAYRTDESVDIQNAQDASDGYNVGWIRDGEWLEYTVFVESTGVYDIDVRVASLNSGGVVRVLFDGVDVTGALSVPQTGGWQEYETITSKAISLEQGEQIMRLAFESGGFNLNWIRVREPARIDDPSDPGIPVDEAPEDTPVEFTLGEQSTMLYHPFVDFIIEDVSYSGNPFDVIARVTFTHSSGAKIRSYAFYDGDWESGRSTQDRWIVRFSGTRLGEWTFDVSSGNKDLDGHTGRIVVTEQTNPKVLGPKEVRGTWFVTKDYRGAEKPWFPLIYLDLGRESGYSHPYPSGTGDYRWDDFPWDLVDLPYDDDERLDEMIDIILYGTVGVDGLTDVGANVLYMVNQGVTLMEHGLWQFPLSQEYWTSDGFTREIPDVRSFYVAETLYSRLADEGIAVNLRLWDGSWSHRKSPNDMIGGINGVVDRRLQRYMAARFGPLFNIQYDYGADLYDRWVTKEEIHDWSSYLSERSDWTSLHTVREWQHNGRNREGFWLDDDEKLDYVNINEAMYWSSTSRFPTRWPLDDPPSSTYDVGDVEDYYDLNVYWRERTGAGRPLFYGAVFQYQRTPYLTMDRTRRFMWQSFMQEGAFAVWGRLWDTGAPSYPNPEQLKTFSEFVDNHLREGMRNEGCATDGYCMSAGSHALYYKEDTRSVSIGLSRASSIVSAVAVDTKADAYREVDISRQLEAGRTVDWQAPKRSDWAIAIETR